MVDLNIRGVTKEQYEWFQSSGNKFVLNNRKVCVGFRQDREEEHSIVCFLVDLSLKGDPVKQLKNLI